jgi:methionyl-tRNA synthetase
MDDKAKKILVTSALPYSNNTPHLGNIVGCVLSADIYARFQRLYRGSDNVIYICGTDEYGTTTEVKAKKENMKCHEICEKYYDIHKGIYEWFNISFDYFGRTSTETHTELVQEMFTNLYKNNLIETGTLTRFYCSVCQNHLADRLINGICYHKECKGKGHITNGDQCDYCGHLIDPMEIIAPKCSICNASPKQVETDHLFLKLNNPDILDKVSNYMGYGKHSDTTNSIYRSWNPIRNRCITRDIKWGIPIPNVDGKLDDYKNKVLYVWFDAPVGYKSILYEHFIKQKTPELAQQWWNHDVDMVEFMGKDNVIFHTIIFPTMLTGSGLPYPNLKLLSSTDYLAFEGEKFSKSKGIGIFGDQLIDIATKMGIGSDFFRYYLIKIRPETKDSNFSIQHLVDTINADLNDNYGNCANRIIKLWDKYMHSMMLHMIPFNVYDYIPKKDIEQFITNIDEGKLRNGIEQIMKWSTGLNIYLTNKKPWYKGIEKEEREKILRYAMCYLYSVTYFIQIYIPNSAEMIINYLGLTSTTWIEDQNMLGVDLIPEFKIPFRKIKANEFV